MKELGNYYEDSPELTTMSGLPDFLKMLKKENNRGSNMNKTIGIIGGMGPKATCDLMEKIIKLSDAHKDQDYVRICVDCNTNIPDRTQAILDGGADPLPELVKSGIRLQDMGSDVLIMPCNTAHYYYDKLIPFFEIPILHMPVETAKLLEKENTNVVGVLATDGTIKSGVYETALKQHNIEAVYPEEKEQKRIMSLIYECIKSGKNNVDDYHLSKIIELLYEKGAEKIILGCTELPIAFGLAKVNGNFVDPTEILAYSALRYLNKCDHNNGIPG